MGQRAGGWRIVGQGYSTGLARWGNIDGMSEGEWAELRHERDRLRTERKERGDCLKAIAPLFALNRWICRMER